MHRTANCGHAEGSVVEEEMRIGEIESDMIGVSVGAAHADAEAIGVRQHDGAVGVIDW